jgi:hypothetical protein
MNANRIMSKYVWFLTIICMIAEVTVHTNQNTEFLGRKCHSRDGDQVCACLNFGLILMHDRFIALFLSRRN